VVRDYLGRAASVTQTLALALLNCVGLLAYYLGFALTLADATGLPAELFGALLFLLSEWLLLTNARSFSEIYSIQGVLALLLACIFPVLLLVASRRKGDLVPGVVLRVLGHPIVLSGIYLLTLAGILLHGLVIWEHPLEQTTALVAIVLTLGLTGVMLRQGAFPPRIVVELRWNRREGDQAKLRIIARGAPLASAIRLGYPSQEQHLYGATAEIGAFAALSDVLLTFPAAQARELKVWAHQIDLDGASTPMPIQLMISDGDASQTYDLWRLDGQVVVLLSDTARRIRVRISIPTHRPIEQQKESQ
jgi:hypothetical protein